MIRLGAIVGLLMLLAAYDRGNDTLRVENAALRASLNIAVTKPASDRQCVAWLFNSSLLEAKRRICQK